MIRALLLVALALPALAHEIPSSVVVQSYVKPERDVLNVLVRVPLEAMRDVNFPLRGPGYLDMARIEPALRDAATIWIANAIQVTADGEALAERQLGAVRLSLPSNRAFRDYESALAHLSGDTLPADTELYRDQALLDVWLRYPIADAGAAFAIDPGFRRLGVSTRTVLHFLPADGEERLFEFSGDAGVVELDPAWHTAFLRFVDFGVRHILDGTDHLLFVLCLILPFRRIRPLIAVVTSFTVAHSITLIGSAFGMTPQSAWFPALIESLIAASIVYMALENVVGSRWERRWLIAFGFGLVHGFGFSFALSETLQFAGGHLLTSLFAFNLGVELGQLLIIAIAVPALNLLFRAGVPERIGTILLSAILAHGGWHWMSERVSELAEYSFTWPPMNAAFFAGVLRGLMLLLVIGSVAWIMARLYRRLLRDKS